ncbi:MAG: SIS domain-containing protein [Candidatus Krumholzibacteria bacterium]|nr:SIS domain-containing protein [Candidatus Krumholzibacteria bacterium]
MEKNDGYIEQVLGELDALRKVLESFPREQAAVLVEMARLMAHAIESGKIVLTCGNGGSAADAQHIAGELVGRFRRKKLSGYKAFALTTNSSVVTAIANDFGYDDVFSKQIEAIGSPGDVLLALSTSGNSANAVEAISMASKLGMKTFAFTGAGGGSMAAGADLAITVPDDDFARIQEIHMTLGHILCGLVEEILTSPGQA